MKKLLYVLTLLVFSVALISISSVQIMVTDASGRKTMVNISLLSASTPVKIWKSASQAPLRARSSKTNIKTTCEDSRKYVDCNGPIYDI